LWTTVLYSYGLHFLSVLKVCTQIWTSITLLFSYCQASSWVLFGGLAPRSHKSSIRNSEGHTMPSTLYYLSANYRHTLYVCTRFCQATFSLWLPWRHKHKILQFYTFLLCFFHTSCL